MNILKRMGTGIGAMWALLSGVCFVDNFHSIVSGTFTPVDSFFSAHPLFCCAVVLTLAAALMGLCMGEE